MDQAYESPSQSSAGTFHIQDLFLVLRRNRWLVALTAIAGIGVAGALNWHARPVFQSSTTLRIDVQQAPSLLAELSPFTGKSARLETEIAVLRSRTIAETVVDSLGLQLTVVQPEISRDRVFSAIQVGRGAQPASYSMHATGNGSYRITPIDEEPLPGVVAVTAHPGVPIDLAGARVTLHPDLARRVQQPVRFAVRPYRMTVAAVRGGLSVVRPELNADVVSITYRDTDPVLAAAVPNAVTASFIQYKRTASKGESRSTVEFLRDQVRGYEQELQDAETHLRTFRERQQMVSPEVQATEQVRRLASLQAEREQLRGSRDLLATLLSRVSAASARPGAISDYRELASHPDLVGAPSVQDLLRSLTELENRRADIGVHRANDADEARALDGRIAELQQQLLRVATAQMNNANSRLAELGRVLNQYGAELQRVPSTEIELARLARQQKLLEDIYTLLQTRLKEAEIQEAVEPGSVRVVDAALVPEIAVAPRPRRNLALGAMLGLVIGLAMAFAREALDTKIRTREDATSATSGLVVLGAIPHIRAPAPAKNGKNGKASIAADRGIARLVTRDEPLHPVAEAYRALRTSITFTSVKGAPQVLVFTSALPGDGKTTSASNLAVSMVQQGLRTLLVDADLRRGFLHKILEAEQQPGLTHLLAGQSNLDDAIQAVKVTDADQPLHFLSSGAFPPHPAELLGSDRMKDLVAQMRTRYEVVVFDAPPLNLVTDAAILGTIADATILVARAGVTDRRDLHHAAQQLRQLHAPLAGLVLNAFDVAKHGGYGYGYGYGYGGYGVRNGSGHGND